MKFFLLVLLCGAIFADNINGRSFDVYAPSGLAAGAALLISCHGMNQDVNYQKNQCKYEGVADKEKFVVVYPQGQGNSWDISGDKDINFILAIIDEMATKHGIDKNKVYLSGFSMGSMFTYLAATKISDKIACFAPVSGYLFGGANTQSKRPIPLIHTHGTTDDVLSYDPVYGIVEAWAKRDGCEAQPEVTERYQGSDATYYHWKTCDEGVEVAHIKLPGKGHWHSMDAVKTSDEIWKFCSKFSLK